MRIKVVFMSNLFKEVKKCLKWDGKEKIVYALCHSSRHEDNIKLMPYSLLIPNEKDYIIRSSGYLKVKKKFLTKVINLAIQSGSDVIQIHIHPPGAGGRFSPVDKHDEPIIMRHVANQVNGIYHASIVFSHDFQSLLKNLS